MVSLSLLFASAQGLAVPGNPHQPPISFSSSILKLTVALMRRDYGNNSTSYSLSSGSSSSSVQTDDISIQNNVGVNINASPSSAVGINVDIDDSISYGDNQVDVDTHIEIDVNGRQCLINSVGVTIKTKINGVWYDQSGKPASVTTRSGPTASQLPGQKSLAPSKKPLTPPSYPSSSCTTTSPTTTSTTSPTTTSTTSKTTTTTTPVTTTSSPTPTNFISGEGVYGISWDPFKGTDQSCKTPSEIMADITQLVSYGYINIRLYGVECQAIKHASNAVQETGTNLILGVYETGNYTAETADLIQQVDQRLDPLPSCLPRSFRLLRPAMKSLLSRVSLY